MTIADRIAILDARFEAGEITLLELGNAFQALADEEKAVKVARLVQRAERSKRAAQWVGGVFNTDARTNRLVATYNRTLDRLSRVS